MNAQIGQTENTQGAFIVYENVLFIRGKVKKLTENTGKVACKPESAGDGGEFHSNDVMCKQPIE